MTDTEQSAAATLRELLPEIEGEDAPVGCTELLIALGVETGLAWSWLEDRRHPLLDLTAADDLCREVLPGWTRCSWRYGDGSSEAELSTLYQVECAGQHPTSEPRAILAALVRARIATLETEDA